MRNQTTTAVEPYISAKTKLPEITWKAFILGVLLSLLMAGSNAYLVLKVGMSVSACIPAAVISMAVLKLFRTSNILENNIVQTTASAGEVVACGVALIIPALVMIGYWDYFPYIIVVSLSIIGGLLGVLLSIPLRRAMIVESRLKFPEGVATAEVLKAGDDTSTARGILYSGLAAAVVKFCQSGFQILADSLHIWGRVGSTVTGVTVGFSFALIGAGYVLGLHVAVCTFSGAALAWFIGVPLYGALFGLPVDAPDAYSAAVGIWNTKIRIIGVGMMVFGGLFMLFDLIEPIRRAVTSSLESMRKLKTEGKSNIARTDLDIPITYVAFGAALLILPIYIIFDHIVTNSGLELSTGMIIIGSITITLLTFILSAFASSISSYMCGLIGSSNNPISGVVLISVLVLAFILLLVLGFEINFSPETGADIQAAGITLLVGVVVGAATAVSGDNLQDLKSGQLLGSTPWKQQLMLGVGVVASALILAPIFQLLFEAYGFGEILPREGMDPTQALSAPKAALLAAVSEAIFSQSMDWSMIFTGFFLGIIVVIIDRRLKKIGSNWRLPILGVAVGIYMPLDVTVPLLFGGIIAALSKNRLAKSRRTAQEKATAGRRGILFASGLIAGEAIVGILLAFPFVAYQSSNVFRIVPDSLSESTDVFGLIVTIGLLYWFYRVSTNVKKH